MSDVPYETMKEDIEYYFDLENRIRYFYELKKMYVASYYSCQSFVSGTLSDGVIQYSHRALSPEQHALHLVAYERGVEGKINKLKDRHKHFHRYLSNIDIQCLIRALNSQSNVPSVIEIETYEEIQEIELYIKLKYGSNEPIIFEKSEPEEEPAPLQSEAELQLLQRLRSLNI